MRIHVVCFGILRDHLPSAAQGNRATVELDPPVAIEDVARELDISSRHLFAVLVNGERAALTTELHDGDEVTLMPPFSGGS